MNTTTIKCPVCDHDKPQVLGWTTFAPERTQLQCSGCTYGWSVERQPEHPQLVQVERIQLRAEGGRLYFNEQLLFVRHDAGDVSTAQWPCRGHKQEIVLATALYDLRECDVRVSSKARVAILPSGREFHFDDFVA